MDELKKNNIEQMLRYICSPIDQSELSLNGEHCLQDMSGNRFPVVKGVPILIPDLPDMLMNHYDLCKSKAQVPVILQTNSPEVIATQIQTNGARFYLFGFSFDVYEMGEAVYDKSSKIDSGALDRLPSGKIAIGTDFGFIEVIRFALTMPSGKLEEWEKIVREMLINSDFQHVPWVREPI